MDYKAELYLNPLFDYLEFFKGNDGKGKLTDCELTFEDGSSIRAHAIVLANSSELFKEAFTGSLQEAQEGRYSVLDNPMNVFPKVIEFLYNGRLEYDQSEVMSLLHVAKAFRINSLLDRMYAHLNKNVNHENIFFYSNQCYQNGYDDLDDLIEFFYRYYDSISIENFSNNLDVVTFCKILARYPEKSDSEKLDILSKFIGDFQCDEVEKAACKQLFNTSSKKVVDFLRSKKCHFLDL